MNFLTAPMGRDAGHRTTRLRIAVVTETYPPEVNGVAITLSRLVEQLRSLGHTIQVIRPRQEADATAAAGVRPSADLLMEGLPIPGYPQLRMGWPAGRRLAAQWRACRPDVVHVATEGPLGYSAVRAARALGIAVSSDFRTNFHAYSQHYRVGWLKAPILAYLRHFHNAAHVTMVPTVALRDELAQAGCRNLTVVARGVDAERFSPLRRNEQLRRSWGVEGANPVYLYVGRMAAEKNLQLLVTAWLRLRTQCPKARLVMVGDGPLLPALRERLPDAHFAGSRRGLDLAEHYASADAFLFPSMTETFGNVTAEAMSSGLAVVAFDHAAAGEMIDHGTNGLLAALNDEEAFIRNALALLVDPLYRAELCAAARRRACDQDWNVVAGQFERVLRATSIQPPAATLTDWEPSAVI